LGKPQASTTTRKRGRRGGAGEEEKRGVTAKNKLVKKKTEKSRDKDQDGLLTPNRRKAGKKS